MNTISRGHSAVRGVGAIGVPLPLPAAAGAFSSFYAGSAADRAVLTAYEALARSLYYLETASGCFVRHNPLMSPQMFLAVAKGGTLYASASCVMYTAWKSQIPTKTKQRSAAVAVPATQLSAGEPARLRSRPSKPVKLCAYSKERQRDREQRYGAMASGIIKVEEGGDSFDVLLDDVLVPHISLHDTKRHGVHIVAARPFPPNAPITIFVPSVVWKSLPVRDYSIADYGDSQLFINGPRVSNGSPDHLLCAAHFANVPDELHERYENERNGAGGTTGKFRASALVWYAHHRVVDDTNIRNGKRAVPTYTSNC